MGESNTSPDFMKHELGNPIPSGWNLPSAKEVKDNLTLMKAKIKLKQDEKIIFPEGWGNLESETKETIPISHKMHVVLIGGAPKFLKKKKKETIPFGWRIACLKEAIDYLDTVKQIIGNDKTVSVADGWVDSNGGLAHDEKSGKSHVLLIKTRPKK
ncbi:hypothetical protein SUGI_0703440 [Cryptomeria japonica]|nr:hypothetical protein SUGI_0703440 [Cryptomeria japonica]